MIDLDAVASLRAVSEHGSVTAAAAHLGYTPSAVSQQVKRLERQTGAALLERVGRRVVPTAAGRHLVDEGGRLLGELESLESGLHRLTGAAAGEVRVVAFSTAMRGLVAPRLGALRTEHPGLTLVLTEEEPWDTVGLVAGGRHDLGVVHSWGDVPLHVPPHLERTELAQDVADVVLRDDHPLASRASLTPADLLDEAWVGTPEGTICREWLQRMYVGTGSAPRIAHVSLEYDSHLALVRAGLGIALVPRLGRSPLAPPLTTVPVTDPVPTRSVVAVHRRSMTASPSLRVVLEALRDPRG